MPNQLENMLREVQRSIQMVDKRIAINLMKENKNCKTSAKN